MHYGSSIFLELTERVHTFLKFHVVTSSKHNKRKYTNMNTRLRSFPKCSHPVNLLLRFLLVCSGSPWETDLWSSLVLSALDQLPSNLGWRPRSSQERTPSQQGASTRVGSYWVLPGVLLTSHTLFRCFHLSFCLDTARRFRSIIITSI